MSKKISKKLTYFLNVLKKLKNFNIIANEQILKIIKATLFVAFFLVIIIKNYEY